LVSGAVAEDPVVVSLRAQIDTAERMEATVEQAQEQLERLDTALGQATAAAVELSARTAIPADTNRLGDEVNHLVDELTVLRSALDEAQALGP